MALHHLSSPGKILELEDGIQYAYVYVAAAQPKPTFLFLHGFPSSSYDWRHQVNSLTSLGFGVVVPDLLGYGNTSKPASAEAYSFKKMAGNIIEILNKESVEIVIGVGHDWGSGLLSRLVNYYPSRFSAAIFTSVSYIEPGVFDWDGLNAMTEQAFGYPTFGYWEFFNSDDAAELCNRNNESVTSLLYPHDPEIWKSDLGPKGAARAWVTANIIKPRPQWLTESEVATHNQIFAEGGYQGPLNWYKTVVRGLFTDEDKSIPDENLDVKIPTLVIVSDEDYVTRAEMAAHVSPHLKNVTIKKIEGCGHWIQLQKSDEFSQTLIDFAEKI